VTNDQQVNNNSELTGRTIGRANARLITTEEANTVGGSLALTSSACICICGRDCAGFDE